MVEGAVCGDLESGEGGGFLFGIGVLGLVGGDVEVRFFRGHGHGSRAGQENFLEEIEFSRVGVDGEDGDLVTGGEVEILIGGGRGCDWQEGGEEDSEELVCFHWEDYE